jgi:hypothetical protein
MRAFSATLRSGDVRVIHNADDFILGAPGLAFLEQAAGEYLTLFPTGGHMGNLYEPQVRDAVLDALGTASASEGLPGAVGEAGP